MKILLYSDYKCMPNKEIIKMLDKQSGICLFCSYADELAIDYKNKVLKNLSKVFSNIIELTPKYEFTDKIDCIFINGGNIFELIYKLHKYNQFEKVRDLCLKGVLYIGNSAGSQLIGTNNFYVNKFEPPKIKMNLQENSHGLGLYDGLVFVHTSKKILSFRRGVVAEPDYQNYIKYMLKEKTFKHICIPNNGCAIITDTDAKVKKYSWKYIKKINLSNMLNNI